MTLLALIAFSAAMEPRFAYSVTFEEAARTFQDGEFERSIGMLQELVEKGQVRAQSFLGLHLQQGIFIQRDIERAAKLLSQAAAAGDPDAQLFLAELYFNGDGVPRDTETAVNYVKKAAANGQVEAQMAYGILHLIGKYVPKDVREAVRLLRSAARNGSEQAAAIGAQADFMSGSVSDWSDLAYRLRMSEPDGVAFTQYSLGALFFMGKGVEKDEIEAFKWLTLAEVRDDLGVLKLKKDVEQKLSSSQKAVAVQRAHQWLRTAASNSKSYIGRASQWCLSEQRESINCIKFSIVHHEACQRPFLYIKPQLVFDDYSVSGTYRYCRSRLSVEEENLQKR